jgi:hypothetical protein
MRMQAFCSRISIPSVVSIASRALSHHLRKQLETPSASPVLAGTLVFLSIRSSSCITIFSQAKLLKYATSTSPVCSVFGCHVCGKKERQRTRVWPSEDQFVTLVPVMEGIS